MSSSSAHGDVSVSAASFLASISAGSSTTVTHNDSTSAATSAPVLPMSAKVSLIDAQIDALEGRIEQAITTHADQLRARATATRPEDHDLIQLWRCINQTSTRSVTIDPQLAPIASGYHDALAQSSKQGLLISVLSDLLAATKYLEKLEKLQYQSDLSSLRTGLLKVQEVMQPFQSPSAFHNLAAVAELTARFERLETMCKEAGSVSSSARLAPADPVSTARSGLDQGDDHLKDASSPSATQTRSPALQVLDAARALIVARGPEAGWKEVRIQLDAHAPPPAVQPAADPSAALAADSSRSSIDSRPDRLLRDEKTPEPALLTRNSSNSSTTNARNKHKPKLGARLIRPQDQLGSGPFNAEDTSLDADGWGLDDDDDEITQPPLVEPAPLQPQPSSSISQSLSHKSEAALSHDDHHSSPSNSVSMQRGMSSSSSQRSTFAFQEPEQGAKSPSATNDVDAWGLGEDDDPEVDAWDLNADEASQPLQPSPMEEEMHVTTPDTRAQVPPTQDAWGPEDKDMNDEDPWALQDEPQAGVPPIAASRAPDMDVLPTSQEHSVAHPAVSHTHHAATQSDMSDATPQIPTAEIASSAGPAHQRAAIAATMAPSHHAAEGSSQADDAESRLRQASHMEQASQQPLHTEEAGQQNEAAIEAPQHLTTSATDEEDHDPEEDAWGFEDGSSASEADLAELTPSTAIKMTEALKKPALSSGRSLLADDEANGLETPATSFEAVQDTIATQSQRVEPAEEPASPSGWRLEFSDSDSQGDAAPDPLSFSALPGAAKRHASANIPTPQTVVAEAKADVSLSANIAAPSPSPTHEAPAILKEECTISQRSLDLIKLAESTMSSVISLLRGESQPHASVDDADALAGAIFKIFELHRALMPVAHGEVLRDVPALAMQFFNDCEYLARELTRLVSDKGEAITMAWMSQDAEAAKRWKTKELVKLEQEAALTRGLGQRWFEAQMTAQSKILLDTLMEADGFARTFEEHRFARCERCVKQVEHTLQQLAKAWRPVLVPSRFYAALGRLVDLVFQKVLHDVLDLGDIGESESEKIASLVKTLGNLEGLFSAEGSEQSVAPLWVPSWFKTSYLIEILTGSLVDIEFLAFEAGALVDYSRGELSGLIKALFADTSNRSRLLRRIETASIDVLAH